MTADKPTVTPLTAEELHRRETDRLEARLWANDDGPSLAGYRQLAFDAISLLKDSTFLDAARTDSLDVLRALSDAATAEQAAEDKVRSRKGRFLPSFFDTTARSAFQAAATLYVRTALSKEERP